MAKAMVILAAVLAAAAPARAQALLPAAYTGPWEGAEPPAGWTFTGLGSPDYTPDYDGSNDGAAKFDGTGDAIEVQFGVPAASVSFWVRGLSFSGGVFRVEQSVDGGRWEELAAYAPPPTNATFAVLTPALYARRVRWIYSEKGTGNVGIDGISIAPSPFFVVGRIGVSNGIGRIWAEPTVTGRLYALERTANLVQNPVPWETNVFSSWGTGGELELIDFHAGTGWTYRVRDITP